MPFGMKQNCPRMFKQLSSDGDSLCLASMILSDFLEWSCRRQHINAVIEGAGGSWKPGRPVSHSLEAVWVQDEECDLPDMPCMMPWGFMDETRNDLCHPGHGCDFAFFPSIFPNGGLSYDEVSNHNNFHINLKRTHLAVSDPSW